MRVVKSEPVEFPGLELDEEYYSEELIEYSKARLVEVAGDQELAVRQSSASTSESASRTNPGTRGDVEKLPEF